MAFPIPCWADRTRRGRSITRKLAIALALVGIARAQFVQQGGKLVGTGAVGDALQGSAVAASADGNTIIVGGPDDNTGSTQDGDGATWVFTRTNGAWTQQGSKLVGTGATGGDGSMQGFAVALSSDGNTAIVGGPNDNFNGSTNASDGAVWVFTRSNGAWTQQGGKLVGTGAVQTAIDGATMPGGAEQGVSVALSADGDTAIVGGQLDGVNKGGAAWVFTRSNGVWTQQGNKLAGTGATSDNAQQGYAVALSADGNTAIVGGPYDGGTCNGSSCVAVGAAWVFTRSAGGAWEQQGGKLVGTGAVGDAYQGTSVAISADGNTAIVGGPDDNPTCSGCLSAGAAWVFTRSADGTWTQQGSKLVGSGAIGAAVQGIFVALSSDGNTAIVGGSEDNHGAGATWVFTRSNGVWTEGGKLVGAGAENGESGAGQGYAVALSSDGATAVVGGPSDNNNGTSDGTGATWVFVLPATPSPVPSVTTYAPTAVTSSTATLEGGVNPNGIDTYAFFFYGTNSSTSGALSTPPQDIGSGTAPLPPSAPITGLTANTTYYVQAVGQNGAGTVRGSVLSFTTSNIPPAPPAVTTSPAASIAGNSATLNGSVNPNGLDTQVWFVYSTSSSLSRFFYTAQQDVGSGTAAVPISAGISGLSAGTTYYFQLVAQSAAGTFKGSILSFITASIPPVVTTFAATSVSDGTATLGASVNPNGLETQVWFLYGTDSNLKGALSSPKRDIGAGITAVSVSGGIASLTMGTTYYFQAVAQSSGGTAYGSILSFTTLAIAPTAATTPASSVTLTGAILQSTVNPNGLDTHIWFLYSTSSSLSGAVSTPQQDIGSSTAAFSIGAGITLLSPDTTYYFQVLAQSGAGTSKGLILSFTTATATPTASTSAATSVTASSAILEGSVNPNGLDTQVWFLYGTDSNLKGALSSPQQDIGAGSAAVSVSASVGGLATNVNYYFQVVAQNSVGGTAYGSILTFTTSPIAPTAVTTPAASITQTSAMLQGTVNPNGLETRVWFLYGTDASLNGATATPQQDIGSGTAAVPVTAGITGLSANTTYYFQVVAQNGAAMVKGAALSLNTVVFVQQGGKLQGTDQWQGPDYWSQGSAVALSADGNTAIVGAPSGLEGAIFVFTRSGGVWTQQGDALAGASGADQGISVALSADGNTAIVGGPGDETCPLDSGYCAVTGATVVFTRSADGTWTQQGRKLVGSGSGPSNQSQVPYISSEQGASVALSSDGNTGIVGGSEDNSGAGATWVFTRSADGTWTQQGDKLVGAGAEGGQGPNQGTSVAISADGNTAIVGGPLDGANESGAVWVFTRSADGTWTQQGSKLVGTGAVGGSGQGTSVALSADGNTAVVGGPDDNAGVGAAWVFTRSGGVWAQQGGKVIAADAVGGAGQGTSVAISADGNTAIVGGSGENGGFGAAWAFTRSGGVWTQLGGPMVGSGAAGNAKQGSSVALSGDGNTAILGGPHDNSIVGAAWAFTRGTTTSTGPQFSSGGVVNAASFQPGPNGGAVAPGEIISIFGAGIGPSHPASGYDAQSNTFATSVAGTQVFFDGTPAPIIYASSTQTSLVVPYEVASQSAGATQVTISYQTVQSTPVTLSVAGNVPGIFALLANGVGQAAALNQDFSVNSSSNPEKPGNVVQVFLTVGGDKGGVDGALATTAVYEAIPFVTIGGQYAHVIYAGPSPGSVWGLTQVDVVIPTTVQQGGDVPLVINYSGISAQPGVTIAVAPPSN
jgi:uncharacterized protein (TIGR03437 family)